MIQTVNGCIESDEIGITMSHEHICVDLSRVRNNLDSTFGNEPIVIEEIKQAMDLKVKTFIEVTCNDMGRDAIELKNISDKTGIQIVASTGFYLDEYHSNEVKNKSIKEIAEIFIHDLTVGIDDTSIKAGVIGEVASSEIMTKSEEKVLHAAAIAANSVGCAITTHCQSGKLGEEQITIFLNEKVNPDKVILGHIDLSNDINYMISLMEKGFNIGFDTIGKEAYLLDTHRANNLKTLIDKGYADKIVLSQDISRKSYFNGMGEYLGYSTVMKKFIPMLFDVGVKRDDVFKMLMFNPQRIFDIQ